MKKEDEVKKNETEDDFTDAEQEYIARWEQVVYDVFQRYLPAIICIGVFFLGALGAEKNNIFIILGSILFMPFGLMGSVELYYVIMDKILKKVKEKRNEL